MTPDPGILRDLAYVFVAAVAGGLLAWRLRQPLILGYVFAGVVISPLTPGPRVSDVHTLESFAEIGVILLMFSVGLEYALKDLLRAKWVTLAGGSVGILLLIGMGIGAGRLVGWNARQGLVIGAIICVSSTMVLTRLLADQGRVHTSAGRIAVAITLVEDLAGIVLIILIPSFASFEPGRIWPVIGGVGRAVAILVPAFVVAWKVVPPALRRVARTQNRELFFIVTLAICLGTAALTHAVGLSLALGAFVAGLIISGSEYAHEALAQLSAFRDAFVALFFVTIGLLIDPRLLFSNLPVVLIMVALIIFGKFAVWTGIVRLFGYPIWTALTVSIGLTQIGEISYVLVQVARSSGMVGDDIYNATLAASLVTILFNAVLVRQAPGVLARMRRKRYAATDLQINPAGEDLQRHTVLCGFGRVGSAIGTALSTFGVPHLVVEVDPDLAATLRARGIPTLFGDAAHRDILQRAGVEKASIIIVTIPDPDRARLAVMNARRLNPDAPILARAHRTTYHEALARAGATEIIQPELEASSTLIRHAFSYLKVPDKQIRAYLRGFRKAMDTLHEKNADPSQSFAEVREASLADSDLVGRSIRNSEIWERFHVAVVSVRRPTGEILLNPDPGTILEHGDKLRVLGFPDEVDTFVLQASQDSKPQD